MFEFDAVHSYRKASHLFWACPVSHSQSRKTPSKSRRFGQTKHKIPSQAVRTDVRALDGGARGTETQADILVPTTGLADLVALGLGLRVLEDVRLLLVSALGLDGQLGRHGCGVLGSTRNRVSSWGWKRLACRRMSKSRKIR